MTEGMQSSDAEGRRAQFAGMDRVVGEVTAVSGTTLTVKTGENGTVQVVTTNNTRLMKDRGPVKIGDLHGGDGLMAMGLMDAPKKTLHAVMVFAEDAAQVKLMRENLGKTYISGRVTGIDLDNARMTVQRADGVAQTIGFDETTSFKRALRKGSSNGDAGGSGGDSTGPGAAKGGERRPGGGGMGAMAMNGGIDRAFNNGESITLGDIKIGDLIGGTGAIKNGVFVPTRVVDSPPRPHRSAPAGAAGPARTGAAGGDGPGGR